MIIVSDTSPLSNLARVEQLKLLHELYGIVIISDTVAQELKNASSEYQFMRDILDLSWVKVQSVINIMMVERLQIEENLDQGEADAIVLALELSADRLLIDERLGRQVAVNQGLPVIGVLGILITAKREGLILSIQPILDDLINKVGFRVSDRLYLEVLKTADER